MTAAVIPILDVGDYEEQVGRAARTLQEGGVVVLPTETVYGGAAVLSHAEGLRRLRELPPAAKPQKPLVIHLARRDDAVRFLGPVHDLGRRMMKKLWPGPVSLVFEVPEDRRRQAAAELSVPEGEVYENGTITLRCPDDIIFSDVSARAGGPVVMRKAGGSADTGAQQIKRAIEEWGELVDLIINAGPTRYSKPSTMLKVKEDGYEVIRAGVYDQRIIERLLRTTLLYVCSGNTCRSPMAEAITRKMLAEKLGVSEAELEKKGVNVISAGSFAMPGARATPAAVEALRSSGVDLSRHRSRPLSVELIHEADIVFAMGRQHLQAVLALVPMAADKVVTLNPEGDIEDPIGSDLSTYQSLAGQLHTLIEKQLAERSIL